MTENENPIENLQSPQYKRTLQDLTQYYPVFYLMASYYHNTINTNNVEIGQKEARTDSRLRSSLYHARLKWERHGMTQIRTRLPVHKKG